MHAKGRKAGIAGATGHAAWTFVRLYVVRRGFLDGREGFLLAVMAAMGSFIRYNKLILLNKQNN